LNINRIYFLVFIVRVFESRVLCGAMFESRVLCGAMFESRVLCGAMFESRVLCGAMFETKRKEVTRKLNNEDLHNLYSSLPIIRLVKPRRTR
jgi:hypothetical protein